jgi:hypothetical protein
MEAGTVSRTDSWYRHLKNDRLEVFLVGDIDGCPLKMRASGPTDRMWEVVAMFEEMTGCAVDGTWLRPPRTGARPLEGQLNIIEALAEEEDGEE